MQAEVRTWQKRKADGTVGETVYKGIFIPVGEHGILVPQLSHGWRVLQVDPDTFVFSSDVRPVKVLLADVMLALQMLAIDKLLQSTLGPRFQELMDPSENEEGLA